MWDLMDYYEENNRSTGEKIKNADAIIEALLESIKGLK